MTNVIKKVILTGIRKGGIRQDPEYSGRIILPLELSEGPDPRWIQIFENSYASFWSSRKGRYMGVESDSIVLSIRDDDELQEHYDNVKKAVENTNEEVNGINAEIAANEKARAQEEQIIKEKIEKIREKADKIKR